MAVVGAIGTIGTGIDAAKGLAQRITGGERGSGQTRPDTLAHAIDKLEGANDPESERIAPLAVQAFRDGSKYDAAVVIERELGKGDPHGLMNSHKWDYINRMLEKEAAEAEMQNEAGSPPSAISATGTNQPVTPSGGISTWGIVAGSVGIISVITAAIIFSR